MKTKILTTIFALFALVMISTLANAALELTEAGETVDLKFRPEERRENPGSRAGNMIFYS